VNAQDKTQQGAARADHGIEVVRRMAPLFAAGFLAYGYNNVFMTLTPQFVQEIGGGLGQAGLQGTVFLLAAVAMRFFFGPLADRVGTKPVMLVGVGSFVLAAALLAYCEAFWQVLAVRIVQAVGLAAFYPCATASVASGAPAGRSGALLGAYRFVTAASLLIGPTVALHLANSMSYRLCFFVMCAVAAVALGFIALIPNAASPAREVKQEPSCRENLLVALRKSITADPGLMCLVLGATLVAAMGYGLLFSFAGSYVEAVSPNANWGMYFSLVGVGGLLANLIAGWVADRANPRGVLVAWLACMGVGVALMGAFPYGAELTLVVSGVLVGLGYSGAITTVIAFASAQAEPNLRASVLSLQQNAIDLGIALGSGLFGALFSLVGIASGWVFVAQGCLVGLAALGAGCIGGRMR